MRSGAPAPNFEAPSPGFEAASLGFEAVGSRCVTAPLDSEAVVSHCRTASLDSEAVGFRREEAALCSEAVAAHSEPLSLVIAAVAPGHSGANCSTAGVAGSLDREESIGEPPQPRASSDALADDSPSRLGDSHRQAKARPSQGTGG